MISFIVEISFCNAFKINTLKQTHANNHQRGIKISMLENN